MKTESNIKALIKASIFATSCLLLGTAMAQTDPCANESGRAGGLCNAYCNAMSCQSPADARATQTACDKVKSNYNSAVGSGDPSGLLPCDPEPCIAVALWENGIAAQDIRTLPEASISCGNLPSGEVDVNYINFSDPNNISVSDYQITPTTHFDTLGLVYDPTTGSIILTATDPSPINETESNTNAQINACIDYLKQTFPSSCAGLTYLP